MRNRDVLLMAMCSVLLGTIVIIAWYGSRILFFAGGTRRSSSGGGSAQIIILLAAVVFMILAPIMAQLIYLAISRKREYLADASSALYTRYPEGLASALEKIAASTEQLKSANNATAPMFIINPFRKGGRAAEDLTSTHPPISERIRILRAMAGNISLAGYEAAYNQAHKGGGGVIPQSALVSGDASAGQAGTAVTPDEKERAREASDVLWKLHNYREVTCDCGLKFKIPPDFQGGSFTCPRCNTTHTL